MLIRRKLGLWLFLFGCFCPALIFAQASVDGYGVGKKQDFLQTSSSTPTSHTIINDPDGPFHFSADLEGSDLQLLSPAPKLTLPGSSQLSLAGDGTEMGVVKNYSTKSALDTAFPNGSYKITGGTYTLFSSLGSADAYPTDVPQVINGTWNDQGQLVLDGTTGIVFFFNHFSNYASGSGGVINFDVYSLSGDSVGDNVATKTAIRVSGTQSSDPALESIPMPFGTLQPGHAYYGELSFTRIVDLNTNSSPAIGLGLFTSTTGFIIKVTGVAPVVTTQPIGQTVNAGDSVTFYAGASGNPTPTLQWRKDNVDIPGATGSYLTIRPAEVANSGSYTFVATNGVGVAVSSPATLVVNPATLPTISNLPSTLAVAYGSPIEIVPTIAGSYPMA